MTNPEKGEGEALKIHHIEWELTTCLWRNDQCVNIDMPLQDAGKCSDFFSLWLPKML
jgi:hypothetical protein